MTAIFSKVLNMSMTGSVVILLVMAARLLLKRSPKIYSYALWAVVLFRLLCPVSLSASVSALGLLQPEVTEASPVTSTVSYRPSTYVQRRADAILIPQAAPESTKDTGTDKQTAPSVWDIASCVWLAGVAAMACYSVIQFLRLRRKLVGAAPYGENIYLSDYIASPFVMGVLRPKVYLPSGIPIAERPYILAHEQHHIRRGDPLWKLLGYGALCIHWFNPLAWCAFILAGKDMEMSCDEAVIRQLGDGIRADYASSLLRLATHKKIISGMPLAFGEGDTKGRVRNMANWKKPKVWVSVLCGIVCIGVLVACGVNPKEEPDLSDITRTSGPADVGIGELYFTLPEGFSIEATNEQTASVSLYNHIIQNEKGVVGGVNVWDNPDFPLEKIYDGDTFIDTNFVRWVRALGLPEAQEDASLGSMIGDSLYGDLEAEFFDDSAPTKMDVTHYFFVSDPVVYDVWFDENTLQENIDFTILRTVRLGSEAETSSPVPLPFAIGTLPEGFSHREDESGIRILKGTDTVGGIVGYPIPEGVYDPNDDACLWLEDVGIPDLENPSLTISGMFSWGGINGCALTIVDDMEDPTVKRTHYFRFAGNTLYDFWLDDLAADEVARSAIQKAVVYQEPVTQQETLPQQTELNFYVEGMEETAMATRYAGDGYSIYIFDENWVYYLADGQPVWESCLNPEVKLGVIHLKDMPLSVAQKWVQREFGDFDLIEDNRGGFGGTNAEGIMADVRLISSEDDAYAVCCVYPLEAAEGFGTRLAVMADTFALTSPAATPELSEEEIAFAKAQAVMQGLQDVPFIIQTECRYKNTPEKNYIETFCYDSEIGFLRVTTTADGLDHAQLYVNDRYYTNAGSESSSEPIWVESEAPSEFSGPWLGSFYFIRHYVTYMDTLTDADGTCYMFRADVYYEDAEGYAPCYFVNFYFDPEGNFINVRLEVNQFQDNAFTVTESIVSLDQETIAAEIDKEYQRAIG